MWAIFWLEGRRRFRKTASAMRAAPVTAETSPAKRSVESEADLCSGGVATGVAVEVMPNEGAGEGTCEAAASEEEGAAAGAGGVGIAVGQSIAFQGIMLWRLRIPHEIYT